MVPLCRPSIRDQLVCHVAIVAQLDVPCPRVDYMSVSSDVCAEGMLFWEELVVEVVMQGLVG